MEIAELKNKLKEIDDLVSNGVIGDEKAQQWKESVIAEFERRNIPAAPPQGMPGDFAHFPGRLVEKMIKGLGNASKEMAQNTADRIAQIEKEERETRFGKTKN